MLKSVKRSCENSKGSEGAAIYLNEMLAVVIQEAIEQREEEKIPSFSGERDKVDSAKDYTCVIFLIIVTIFPVNGTPEDDAYVSANLRPDANGRLGETRQMSVIHCTTALLGSAVSASSLDYSKLSGQTGKLKENLQAGEQSLKHLMGIQPVFVSMQMKILGAANHSKNMLGLVITEASELREEEKNQSAVLDFLAKFFMRDAATNFINAVKDLKRQLEKKISIWKVK